MTGTSMNIEKGHQNSTFDDDGHVKRTGTLTTVSAHIITAVIGSGVLSLAWATAQLGWIVGPLVLLVFAVITWYTSLMLADCYRHPVTGKRNYTYKECVQSILGGKQYMLCAVAQYVDLAGVAIGYTLTAAISMAAVGRAICFHKHGHDYGCHTNNNKYMIIYGVSQILLSQVPNFHKLSWLSVVAAITSFGYSSIALGLSIATVIGDGVGRTTLFGTEIGVDVNKTEKIWNVLTAIGNIAFAYAFLVVFIEIQDTLKSSPPENVVMKKATTIGIFITTFFYTACGVLGYAAFGNDAPGNFLTGFGFYEPYWLVSLSNLFIVIHLIGAFQIFAQPIFDFVETQCAMKYPNNIFMSKEYSLGFVAINLFRLVWRSIYIVLVTLVAMLFPFFNDIMGLLGALVFWPLIVHFPVEMHITVKKIQKYSSKWIMLRIISFSCLLISLVAAVSSIHGLIKSFGTIKPLQSET